MTKELDRIFHDTYSPIPWPHPLGRNTSMWTTERVICIEFRHYVLIRFYLWAQPLDPEIYFYSATWLRIWKSLMPPDLPLKQEGRDHMFSGTRDNSEIESGIRGKKFPPSSIRDVCPFLLTLHRLLLPLFFFFLPVLLCVKFQILRGVGAWDARLSVFMLPFRQENGGARSCRCPLESICLILYRETEFGKLTNYVSSMNNLMNIRILFRQRTTKKSLCREFPILLG